MPLQEINLQRAKKSYRNNEKKHNYFIFRVHQYYFRELYIELSTIFYEYNPQELQNYHSFLVEIFPKKLCWGSSKNDH